jgi:hypothetical protein
VSCPTCNSATMQNLGIEDSPTWWCSRCGTVKTCNGGFENISTPKLVMYVREAGQMGAPFPGQKPSAGCVWNWVAAREAAGVKAAWPQGGAS